MPLSNPDPGYSYYDKNNTVEGTKLSAMAASDGTTNVGLLAHSTGRLKTIGIDYGHWEIHNGNHYAVNGYLELALDATRSFALTTPDTTTWIHMTFQITGTDKTYIDVFESSSGVSGGTVVNPVNNNRNSENTSSAVLLLNPAFANTGSLIDSHAAGANKTTGDMDRDHEFILKQNTAYYFRIKSGANGNIVSYDAAWYEHEGL